VSIKHRIERLESKRAASNQPRYVILSTDDETEDEAKQRYCAENEVSMNEIEESFMQIKLVPLTRAGNIENAA
jgi:hypothetical protein